MGKKSQLTIVWVILVVLVVFGLALGTQVGSLERKPISVGDITQLLATFFVLALFVERTLEVFITAWRGKEKVLLVAEHQALTIQNEKVEDKAKKLVELVEYQSETQAIALRSSLVLGILIAAVGVRTIGTFVEPLPGSTAEVLWSHLQVSTFATLDILISGGIIGGGSDAIHKMMNVITGFLDATADKLKSR